MVRTAKSDNVSMANDQPPRQRPQSYFEPEPWQHPQRPQPNPLLYTQNLPPSSSNASPSGGTLTGQAELTLTPATVAIANRDAVLGKTMSVEIQLRALIDREKDARMNVGILPELEAALADVVDMRTMLLDGTDASIGASALSFKNALVNLWNKEHVSILKLGFDATLFFLGLELIQHFGLLNATIMATVIRQKEIPEALKHLAEIMKRLGSSSRD
jgi:hypothetical protein